MVQLGSSRIESQSPASSSLCTWYHPGTFKVPGSCDHLSMSICVLYSPWSNTFKNVQQGITTQSLYLSHLSKLDFMDPCHSLFLWLPHFIQGENITWTSKALTQSHTKNKKKLGVERKLDPTETRTLCPPLFWTNTIKTYFAFVKIDFRHNPHEGNHLFKSLKLRISRLLKSGWWPWKGKGRLI